MGDGYCDDGHKVYIILFGIMIIIIARTVIFMGCQIKMQAFQINSDLLIDSKERHTHIHHLQQGTPGINTARCGWDRGDCCESTCTSKDEECGANKDLTPHGFRCKDPKYDTLHKFALS